MYEMQDMTYKAPWAAGISFHLVHVRACAYTHIGTHTDTMRSKEPFPRNKLGPLGTCSLAWLLMFSPGVSSVERVLKEPTVTMAELPPSFSPNEEARLGVCQAVKRALTDRLEPRKEDARLRGYRFTFRPPAGG